jgi:hypothetical protein
MQYMQRVIVHQDDFGYKVLGMEEIKGMGMNYVRHPFYDFVL